MKLFNHNTVKKLREQSKKAAPDIDLSNLEPVIASNDGYVLTKDKRILLRFLIGDQPVLSNMLMTLTWLTMHMPEGSVLTPRMKEQDLLNLINSMDEFPRGSDVKGVTKDEIFAMMSRMVAMPELETASLDLQQIASWMYSTLKQLNEVAKTGQPIPEKLATTLSKLLQDLE